MHAFGEVDEDSYHKRRELLWVRTTAVLSCCWEYTPVTWEAHVRLLGWDKRRYLIIHVDGRGDPRIVAALEPWDCLPALEKLVRDVLSENRMETWSPPSEVYTYYLLPTDLLDQVVSDRNRLLEGDGTGRRVTNSSEASRKLPQELLDQFASSANKQARSRPPGTPSTESEIPVEKGKPVFLVTFHGKLWPGSVRRNR